MRVTLRDESRRRIGRIEVDPAARPPRVSVDPGSRAPAAAGDVDAPPREVFLQWEAALDDEGNLRRCIHCGCPDLFQEKAFPPFTGVIVALAFAGAALGILGFAGRPAVLAAMAAVLVVDLGILLVARRRIVCHRCHSDYRGVPIASWHPRWDRQVADRYATRTPTAGSGSSRRRDAELPSSPLRSDMGIAGR